MKIGNARDIHGNPLLAKVVAGGLLAGEGTEASPLEFAGLEARDGAGSAVASGISAVVAGHGVSLSAGAAGEVVVAAEFDTAEVETMISSAVEEGLSGAVPAADFAALSGEVSGLSSGLSSHVSDGAAHLPAGGESGQFLMRTADGVSWSQVEVAALSGGVLDKSVIPDLSDRYAEVDSYGRIGSGAVPDLSGRYAAVDSEGRIAMAALPEGLESSYAQLDLSGKVDSSVLPDYSGTFVALSAKNQADGYAGLDESGKIPSRLLPTAVDDIVVGYYDSGNTREFYGDREVTSSVVDGETVYDTVYSDPIAARANAIYVDRASEKTYRWSDDQFVKYVEISPSLVTGTTPGTAYPGEYGAALASSVDQFDGRVSLLEETLSGIEGTVEGLDAAGGDYVVLDDIDHAVLDQPYVLVLREPFDDDMSLGFLNDLGNHAYIRYVGSAAEDCYWTDTGRLETGHLYAHAAHLEAAWTRGGRFAAGRSMRVAFKRNYEALLERARNATEVEEDYEWYPYAPVSHDIMYLLTITPPRHEFTISGLGTVEKTEGNVTEVRDYSVSNGTYVTYGDNITYTGPILHGESASEIFNTSITTLSAEDRAAGPAYGMLVYRYTRTTVEDGETTVTTGYRWDYRGGNDMPYSSLEALVEDFGGTLAGGKEWHYDAEIKTKENRIIGVVLEPFVDLTSAMLGGDAEDDGYATKSEVAAQVSRVSQRLASFVEEVAELPQATAMTAGRAYLHSDPDASTAGHVFYGRSSSQTTETEATISTYSLSAATTAGAGKDLSGLVGRAFDRDGEYTAANGETYPCYSLSDGGVTWHLTEFYFDNGGKANVFPILTTTAPADFEGDEHSVGESFMPAEATALGGVSIPLEDIDLYDSWYYKNDSEYGTHSLAWRLALSPTPVTDTAIVLSFDGKAAEYSGEYRDTGETRTVSLYDFGTGETVATDYPVYSDGNGHYLFAMASPDDNTSVAYALASSPGGTPDLYNSSVSDVRRLSGPWKGTAEYSEDATFGCSASRKYYHSETSTEYSLDDITPGRAAQVCLRFAVPQAAEEVWLVLQKSDTPDFSSYEQLDQRFDKFVGDNLYCFGGNAFASANALGNAAPEGVDYPGLAPALAGQTAVLRLSDWTHCGDFGWYRYKWVNSSAAPAASDLDWTGGYYPVA